MSFRSIILPQAKQDIREAAKWYNERQHGLGNRFTLAIRKKVRVICQYPDAYGIRYNTTQTTVVDVFPYMIHFIADEKEQTVLVTAVLHTRRNPTTWTRQPA